MKNTDYILYLDMDGVLVDYDSGWWAVSKQLGINKIKDVDFTDKDKQRIGRQINNPSFWSSLGWEFGGEALWKASNELFENVHILTSTAAKKDGNYHKTVAAGKMDWIADHLVGFPPEKVHVVTEGVRKAEFAAKNAILVDDRKSTIEAFNKAGGFGILHWSKHYKKTIQELIEIASPMSLGEIAKRLPVVRRRLWNGK